MDRMLIVNVRQEAIGDDACQGKDVCPLRGGSGFKKKKLSVVL